MIASTIGISIFFMVCGAPVLWNTLRQLFMRYSYTLLQNAKESGVGAVFNYEYYIVNFVLTINNSVNFFLYLMSGSTWRDGFIKYVISTIRRRMLN